MRWMKIATPLLVAIAAIYVNASAAKAQTAKDFYKSNTIRLIVSAGAGGGYDLYARVLARHIIRYLPRTNVIVENMGAAGGLTAANFIYNQAPKDGTVIGALRQTLAFNQLAQPKGIRYDAKKFSWVGSTAEVNNVIFLYGPKSPVHSLEEAKQKEVLMGGTAKDDEGYIQPKTMNELFGTKFKIVLGYSGIPAVDLAIRRGEVNGRQGEWTAVKTAHGDWLRDNQMIVLAQVSINKIRELPNVPRIIDLAKNEDDRQIAEFVSAPAEIGRVIAAPPGVPPDRLEFLRNAFDKTMADPDFRADADRLKLEIRPQSGKDVQRRVDKAFEVPSRLIQRTKTLLQ